jgi:hypothetical protein
MHCLRKIVLRHYIPIAKTMVMHWIIMPLTHTQRSIISLLKLTHLNSCQWVTTQENKHSEIKEKMVQVSEEEPTSCIFGALEIWVFKDITIGNNRTGQSWYHLCKAIPLCRTPWPICYLSETKTSHVNFSDYKLWSNNYHYRTLTIDQIVFN